jgi:hypothetical protein
MANTQAVEKHFAKMRDWIISEGAKGDAHSLDETISSAIYAIIGQATLQGRSYSLDNNLHEFWHMFIEAAKNYHCDNPKQYKLVHQILYVREIGTLLCSVPQDGERQCLAAEVSNGQKIWSDLPYLVQDVNKVWLEDSLNMSTDHRCNFASWIARLAAVGVCGDAFTGCALVLFRDALETPRRVTVADDGLEVPIQDFLPALNAWLYYASHKLWLMSVKSFRTLDPEMLGLGLLVKESVITCDAFSTSRWDFWRTRLIQISVSSTEEVAVLALALANQMKYDAELRTLV